MTHETRFTRTLLAALCLTSAANAASITGTVTNKTVSKPDAGDKVVLIQLAGGMKESTTAITDARGNFTLELPDAGPHLIRVDHQKAGYFHIAPPGTQSVDVDVFDVAEKVAGVTTEANVMRIEADQQGLHVTQNYFVKNASTPPRTQLSPHSYEIYLPDGVQIEGSAAMAPNGMPVASSPVPLGDKGHYAFVFPIRPGETRFQVSYRLPYAGSYKFAERLAIPAENVAIMMPKAMKFVPSTSTPFQPINDDVNAQTFLAKNVSPAQPLEFTVSGLGAMPRESQGQAQGQPQGQNQGAEGAAGTAGAPAQDQPNSPEAGSAAANSDTRPGGGLGNPIDTPDPLTKYRWWILGSLSLVLATAAAFFLRTQSPTAVNAAGAVASSNFPLTASPSLSPHLRQPWENANPAAAGPAAPGSPILAALKDELFALETERLEGKLTEAEYANLKNAFETVLRRALARRTGEGGSL